MKGYKILSLRGLREEMKAVARGERPAPQDAGKTSFNSVDAIIRLLTPENRHLLAVIRDQKPESVAALAKTTGRASPNLTRTLAKLEAAGMVRMQTVGRMKAPRVIVRSLRVEVDPFRSADRVTMKLLGRGDGKASGHAQRRMASR